MQNLLLNFFLSFGLCFLTTWVIVLMVLAEEMARDTKYWKQLVFWEKITALQLHGVFLLTIIELVSHYILTYLGL